MTAASVVALNMVSYCSDLMRELYGWRETRKKAAPVRNSHVPKSMWNRYGYSSEDFELAFWPAI